MRADFTNERMPTITETKSLGRSIDGLSYRDFVRLRYAKDAFLILLILLSPEYRNWLNIIYHNSCRIDVA